LIFNHEDHEETRRVKFVFIEKFFFNKHNPRFKETYGRDISIFKQEMCNFCSSSRKAITLTTGIQVVCRGLKFESDTEIGQKVSFID